MFKAAVEEPVKPAGSAPGANLAFPLSGGVIDGRGLNQKKYIDVTYIDYSGQGIDYATILDDAAEFTLSGDGVGDVAIASVQQLAGDIEGGFQ